MNKFLKSALIGFSGLLLAAEAFANPCPPGNPPTNCAPPTGAIMDFDGTAIHHTWTQYSVSFVATQATTNLSFAFREDPAFISLDDVSLTHNGGANLVTNGGFEDGPNGSNTPNGWTYLNSFGATFAGVVSASGAHTGTYGYYDGAVQAYDGITQAIATVVGDTYDLTFWINDNSGLSTYSRLSTNGNVTNTGGNGVDVLVYAGAIPTLVPEPGSLALVGVALVGAGFLRRRK